MVVVSCVYIFAIGEFFASQTRRYGFILLGALVDISTWGDSAYSDEVVFLLYVIYFWAYWEFPLFVRRDTALRRSLFIVFCLEVPLLIEE